ncbi:amidohydrolase family protein [Sulfobacillus harzensis]|uniref:Amidohydrolase family protein n=1 Tax=Sulfobacillus harzensis TaxID=2729629 RepID=A0A7Y0Q626_9FIRM|nr:amidohydrolase family protein [Sulfobacillus harzensis]NMP24919.1 amidohydrolase family protein [Sulfobacillus harzensis]
MSTAIINIGDSHNGNQAGTPIVGDAIIANDGIIAWIGPSSDVHPDEHDIVIDARGITAVPGFIDSHFHSTFGDYTPRQQTVGFIESYLHGGTTRTISASEVHVPGRPRDVIGVKALAIAAERSFRDYRPGGVTVHAGSVVLEPGLTAEDFRELREAGVWLAKAGFGAFASPRDYVPVVQAARQAGLVVMFHSGGGSIPGSQEKISVDVLLEANPNVAGHINGGPTALSAEENSRIVSDGTDIALQLVQAGNLRSAIHIAELALKADAFPRVMIATDTPTGTGVIPLGMLRSMAELVSLGPLTPRQAIASSTGNVADVYGLSAGRLAVGAPADILLLDAPLGSTQPDALTALEFGDIPAVAAAITQGELRFTKSRNTPPAKRPVKARINRVLQQ